MQNPPGSYPPPQGSAPGGFPPPGGYPGGDPASGKTQTMGLDYNVAAGLCYIPVCLINVIFPILWLATEPKSNKFVRFHALQSLFLLGFSIVFAIGMSIVGFVLQFAGMALESGILLMIVGLIMLGIWLIFVLFLLAMVIMGLIKAFGGQMWKMPIIGNLAEKYA